MCRNPASLSGKTAGACMTIQPRPTVRRLSLSQFGAVVAGNALEFYDFLIFGFFAVQIGAGLLSRP